MKSDEPYFALAKFGRAEHLKTFREQGQLFMNTLGYFWRVENDAVRADWLEGADALIDPDEFAAQFSMEGDNKRKIPREIIAGPVKISLAWTAATNIFCMYALKYPPRAPLVDPRNFEFGDSFVLVTDVPEFLGRIEKCLSALGQRYRFGLVEYSDVSVGGTAVGGFRKDNHFSYQSEFRVAVYSDTILQKGPINQPISLHLGSLEDITAELQPLSRINELIRVRPQ